MTWVAPEMERIDEPFVGGEREMLEGFLDYDRATFVRICAGLSGEQLAMQAVPPSNLSLLGLARHLADVERNWFRRRFAGEETPALYGRADRPDAAFEEIDAATAEHNLEALVAEQQAARDAVADLPLEHVYASPRWGDMTVRWAYKHVIEEYSRHNGHADLLREVIDGRTGI